MTRCGTDLGPEARHGLEAFSNFLSWGEQPSRPTAKVEDRRAVPPAWWAYALGATTYCPPKGEL